MFRGLFHVLRVLETSLLVGLLMGMILLAVLQIALRNLFDTGLDFADTLLRLMVLWTTLVGAMVAARNDSHIRMDLVTRYLSGVWLALVRRLACALTAVVCGMVAWASFRFVVDERSYGGTIYGDIPSWIGLAIMPAAFAVLTIRYVVHTLVLPVIAGPVPELDQERDGLPRADEGDGL